MATIFKPQKFDDSEMRKMQAEILEKSKQNEQKPPTNM